MVWGSGEELDLLFSGDPQRRLNQIQAMGAVTSIVSS